MYYIKRNNMKIRYSDIKKIIVDFSQYYQAASELWKASICYFLCSFLQKGISVVWANCMWLKGVVMKAHYNGLIPRNPFAQFYISPNVKEREYLTEEELKAVMTHKFADSTRIYPRYLRFCQFYRPLIRGHSGTDQR